MRKLRSLNFINRLLNLFVSRCRYFSAYFSKLYSRT